MTAIRKVKAAIERWAERLMPWVFFVCLAAAMLFDPAKVGVPGASFAASLALASVTFSYARTLKDGSAIRDEVVFAGERFIGAAMMFLAASILKYAASDIPRYGAFLFDALPNRNAAADPAPFLLGVNIVISLAAFVVFLVGLLFAQMGFTIVVAVARERASRRPDHMDFFPAPKALTERLRGLTRADAGAPENGNGR